MNFSLNYLDFFDFNDPSPVIRKRFDLVRQDFTENFAKFLTEQDIMPETADAIANAVFYRMSDKRLHYHTPVHVLSMFQFVETHFPDEKLADWEELAVWFHDSVYIPQLPGISEELSYTFMRAMVEPAFTNTKLAEAQFASETTAHHLHSVTNHLYNTVMDLDLASAFIGDMTTRNAAIRREFDYVNDADFFVHRKEFFEKMIGKGFIFRSIEFKDKFEAEAMENIKREIDKCTKK